MADVAKALARPPSYPSKFFGGELGTQVKIDEKKNHYVINGKHEADQLQNLLDDFIEKFVLCASCKNPETEFEFTKDDKILKDCKACGIHSPIHMGHKLVTFILKNRPEIDKNDKYRKANERNNVTTEDALNDGGDEGMAIDAELEKELAALPTADSRVDDDDWAVDTSAEAAAARLKELSVKLPGEKDDDDLIDPVDEFADFITKRSGPLSDEAIIAKAKEIGIRPDKAVTVLVQLLFDEKMVKENQVEKHASLLSYFCEDEKCQKGVLGGVERLVVVSYPVLLPAVSLIFKALYDHDIVEESVFLAWDEKASKKYVDKKDAKVVREKAAPFITWLREAEEEGSEEEQ
ncbi:hypothetical protein HDV03_002842 [Kappamyces sp. JEL0829]|nr:hypothetical protein HDV03_002842 [Kappamyces sp. JEL0829]KAJ3364447.1 hypothetical protein HDU91_002591 [Kappamyces sp. JEL0680]